MDWTGLESRTSKNVKKVDVTFTAFYSLSPLQPFDAAEQKDLQFVFELAFHEPPIVNSDQVMTTLKRCRDVVDNAIQQLAPFL
jgi:hypothetical protein